MSKPVETREDYLNPEGYLLGFYCENTFLVVWPEVTPRRSDVTFPLHAVVVLA